MVRSPITICEILRSISCCRANLRAYHLEIQTIIHSSESLSRPSFWKEHRNRFPTFHSNWTDSESVVKPWRNRSTLEKDLSLNSTLAVLKFSWSPAFNLPGTLFTLSLSLSSVFLFFPCLFLSTVFYLFSFIYFPLHFGSEEKKKTEPSFGVPEKLMSKVFHGELGSSTKLTN